MAAKKKAATLLKLEPDLIKYLDNKLKDNVPFQKAVIEKDPRAIMVLAAEAMVGFKEKTGKNDGKEIVWIQETYGNAVNEPYCIAGVMTCVAYAVYKTGIPHKLFETESSHALWFKTDVEQRVKNVPLPGAVAVWQDVDAKGKFKGTGHGEIVRFADETTSSNVGFNTSGTTKPGATVNREGNGVYYTVRNRKNTASRVFMGFLKPF